MMLVVMMMVMRMFVSVMGMLVIMFVSVGMIMPVIVIVCVFVTMLMIMGVAVREMDREIDRMQGVPRRGVCVEMESVWQIERSECGFDLREGQAEIETGSEEHIASQSRKRVNMKML